MSKERLEEIKKELELDWSDISYVVNQDDVKRLINRVEELEEENKELESLAKMQHDAKIEIEKRCLELEEKLKDQIDSNWKLDKINRMWLRENKRYREALEFYADEESYEPLEVQIGVVTKEGYKISKYKYDPKINTDKGKKARQALEGEE